MSVSASWTLQVRMRGVVRVAVRVTVRVRARVKVTGKGVGVSDGVSVEIAVSVRHISQDLGFVKSFMLRLTLVPSQG